MLFEEATTQFRDFLTQQGHPGKLLWITPKDVAIRWGELLVRPRVEAETESADLFADADAAGFGVSLEAVARLGDCMCCFVWKPRSADDAVHRMVGPPLTMKVRTELRVGREPSAMEWWVTQLMTTERTRSRNLQFFY